MKTQEKISKNAWKIFFGIFLLYGFSVFYTLSNKQTDKTKLYLTEREIIFNSTYSKWDCSCESCKLEKRIYWEKNTSFLENSLLFNDTLKESKQFVEMQKKNKPAAGFQ